MMSSVELPRHLLTLEEFYALPEDNSARFELQEGVLVVTPRPVNPHLRAATGIWKQLDQQVPDGWEVLIESELCLEPAFPPTVRIPDLMITRTPPRDERRTHLEEVLLAIEIISPGSRRMDTKIKPAEYADAGIPHYWVVDLDPPISVAAFHHAGPFGYQEAPAVTGVFTTSEPFDLRIDLTGLTSYR